MNAEKSEDVKNIALKLTLIHQKFPKEYRYIKKWIHYLLAAKK